MPAFTPEIAVHGDLARAAHVAVVVSGSVVDGERFDATERVFDVGDFEHDEYFREGGTSLRALGRIAVGGTP